MARVTFRQLRCQTNVTAGPNGGRLLFSRFCYFCYLGGVHPARPDSQPGTIRPARAPQCALAFALLAAALLVLAPRAAGAQDRLTLNGSWSASSLSESWKIAEWGEACGPRPRPQGAGGGSVQIREQGGELMVTGAGRAWSTAECWEQMPGMSRSSHSASGNMRGWRTRCATAASDPRRATVVTTVSATDTSISLHETGQYQFIIQDTTCSASVSRARSFSLVRRDGEAPPAPSASASAEPMASASAAASAPPPAATPAPPPEKPAPAKPCVGAGSGDPTRLEVRPSRKLLRPGDTFSFRAIVLDAEGCPLPVKPTWSVSPGPMAGKVSVDPQGAVTVAADAGEGKADLVASVGGKGVTITLEIASAENYDALLASSGLNPSGEAEESASAVIATGSIGGRTTLAEDTARARKQVFLAVVGGLAACLALAGLILLRRGRRGRAASAAENAPDEAPASGGFVPPERAPAENGGPPRAAPQPIANGGEAPRPAADRVGAATRGKICPICGQRFGAEAGFCGTDGTALVLIN